MNFIQFLSTSINLDNVSQINIIRLNENKSKLEITILYSNSHSKIILDISNDNIKRNVLNLISNIYNISLDLAEIKLEDMLTNPMPINFN